MSWSLTYNSAEMFRNDIPDHDDPSIRNSIEHIEQVKAAREAALSIIDSHACGKRDIQVTMSGHSNPGHEPTPGWSNDFISIYVSQKPT